MNEFLQELLEWRYFKGDNPAIEAVLDPGQSNVAVITGDNACGKSFVRKLIQCLCHDKKIECIHLSQQGRATGGIVRAMVYGSEDDESTGYISSKCVQTSIKTSQSRTTPHCIFYDEPEIGLSDNNSAAMGLLLKDFFQNPPENLKYVFVATHSKTLVRYLEGNHWHLRLGGCPNLQDWLNGPIVPGNLEQLHQIGIEKWRRIEQLRRQK